MTIPQRPDEMSAAWFTEILPVEGTVTEVGIEEIGADIGFIGQVYRCRLTWSPPGSANDRPSSVIVKVPTANDENFALGDGLQLYEREIAIYGRGRSLGIPMPRHWYSAMDPDPAPWLERPLLFLFDHLPIPATNWLIRQFLRFAGKSKRRYVLVIEDIADARPPSQRDGGSLDDALAALKVLARFHAANWLNQDLVDGEKRIWPLDRAPRTYQAGYVRNRDAFIARFGSMVEPAMMQRLDEIQTRVPELRAELTAAPWTILHGDFRLDNVLFRPDGDLLVIDFQSVGYGRPGYDVAYFVTTALSGEHRTEHTRLLRTYHDELVAAGVSDYRWEQLLDDTAKATEMIAHVIVGAADVLDTAVADGEDLAGVLQLRVLDWLD